MRPAMKILLKHTSIDFSLFHAAVLHETFSVISFCVKDDIDDRCLQIPLCFRNGNDAREAYKRILQGRNNFATNISISEFDCSWPMELAQKIEQYAQHMFDFDRPIKM